MTTTLPDEQTRRADWLRSSAVPYIATLIVGFTVARYLQYAWQYFLPDIPVVKGQPPGIWVGALTVLVSAGLWLAYRGGRPHGWLSNSLFASLAIGWLIHYGLLVLHGDGYDYSVWFYPAVIALIWLKFPTAADARALMLVLGWSATGLLVWTRTSEMLGILPMAPVPSWLLEFELREYWLPLSGWLGPEGRWPGPMGGTAFTGMLGALLVVLAVSLRTRSSWVFGTVGVVTLLLTSSRGAFAATAAGVGVAILFSDARVLRRIGFGWRLGIAAAGALGTAALLFRASPNLTGRTEFWPDFLELWTTAPMVGVGATGYEQGTSWTQSAGSAHSLFIDELARNGPLGFTAMIVTLGIVAALAVRAARRTVSGPLALFVAFAVLGIANTPITWVNPSLLWLFLIIPAIWAGATSQRSEVSIP